MSSSTSFNPAFPLALASLRAICTLWTWVIAPPSTCFDLVTFFSQASIFEVYLQTDDLAHRIVRIHGDIREARFRAKLTKLTTPEVKQNEAKEDDQDIKADHTDLFELLDQLGRDNARMIEAVERVAGVERREDISHALKEACQGNSKAKGASIEAVFLETAMQAFRKVLSVGAHSFSLSLSPTFSGETLAHLSGPHGCRIAQIAINGDQ